MQKPDFQKLLRPEVRGFEPYLPGRSMESVRREKGLRRILKLASNENALGPSPRALKAVASAGEQFFRYPDGASTTLRLALAEHAHVPVEHVMIGAGSDELIELLAKTFLNPSDSIVVSEHAFVRYQLAAELMGAKTRIVPMRKFTHDLDAMLDAVRADTKMLFIANPNNPTGTYNSAKELTNLLKKAEILNRKRSTPLLIIVDEAYYEYARVFADDYPVTLALRKRFPNLVILRTFSKAHALAGLRIGYGFAAPAIVQALDRVRPPFNVSLAGQVAAVASLKDAGHVIKSLRLVKAGQEHLLPALKHLGLAWVPSVANFYLLDMTPRLGRDVFESLLNRGIIVRSMDEYGFPHHIRVTYGLPQENKAFLKALTEVLAA